MSPLNVPHLLMGQKDRVKSFPEATLSHFLVDDRVVVEAIFIQNIARPSLFNGSDVALVNADAWLLHYSIWHIGHLIQRVKKSCIRARTQIVHLSGIFNDERSSPN